MGDISLVTGKMTSMEISRLTGKDHSKVCRDIRKMLKELEIGDATFGDTYRDGQNKAQKMYSLDKRLSLVLATGYSIVWRTKIIDRWEELERGLVTKPKTMIEMLEETVTELKAKEKEIARLGTTITKQNETNVELFEMKAMESKTGLRTIKNDLGVEIGSIVFGIFGKDFPGDYQGMHKHAHSLYRHYTGKIYAGAANTSLDGKKHYLKWLQTMTRQGETETKD